MKHYEFYIKRKINSRPTKNTEFYKRSWWQIVFPNLVAVLIEPFIVYKYQRSVPFSIPYYLRLLEYCFLIALPFILLLLWLNWREAIKQSRGYRWEGKFEVTSKQSSFVFYYLLLTPGNSKLKVERSLFEKTRVGNFILVCRDALGGIEEIKKINDLSSRIARSESKRMSKGSSNSTPSKDLKEKDDIQNSD